MLDVDNPSLVCLMVPTALNALNFYFGIVCGVCKVGYSIVD